MTRSHGKECWSPCEQEDPPGRSPRRQHPALSLWPLELGLSTSLWLFRHSPCGLQNVHVRVCTQLCLPTSAWRALKLTDVCGQLHQALSLHRAQGTECFTGGLGSPELGATCQINGRCPRSQLLCDTVTRPVVSSVQHKQ